MNRFFKIIILAFIVNGTVSCEKDKNKAEPEPTPEPIVTPAPTQKAGMSIVFKNTVDGEDLVFGKTYTNPNGETYTVSKFNYYIGKIVLTRTNHTTYVVNDFYRIVKQSDASSRTITLTDIPVGSYRSVQFILGVDSARNTSGAQTGGLDMAYASDMFWNWSTGYIFLKLEGKSPASTKSNNLIEYHIGGFGGVNKAQRSFNIDFGFTTAEVVSGKTCTVNLQANVNELFKTPSAISFSVLPSQATAGPNAKIIADNYADMITFGSVQNQ